MDKFLNSKNIGPGPNESLSSSIWGSKTVLYSAREKTAKDIIPLGSNWNGYLIKKKLSEGRFSEVYVGLSSSADERGDTVVKVIFICREGLEGGGVRGFI